MQPGGLELPWSAVVPETMAMPVALAELGTPGYIVEHGPTEAMFGSPQDPRTYDYVNGRFG